MRHSEGPTVTLAEHLEWLREQSEAWATKELAVWERAKLGKVFAR